MSSITLAQSNLPTTASSESRWKKFKGTEKAAVVFLCLGEKRGAELMKKLSAEEIQHITAAMSGLGAISAEEIEAVILEFAELFAKDSGLTGSLSIAENMLREFLPEDQIEEVLNKVRGPIKERDLWTRFNAQSETVIAEYLMNEHEQTAAAIISKLNPALAAKVIPLLAPDVMQDVIERMINMETVPEFIMEQIEETLQTEIISDVTQTKETEMQEQMASIFNHLHPELFENIATGLKKNLSETFDGIKKKMFTFDDMINLSPQDLAKITRGVQGNTLPLALRGANKELRDHFLNGLPSRSREMLLDEMNSMGAVRGRDAREAQMLIVEQTKMLVDEGAVKLPMGHEEEDDDILE